LVTETLNARTINGLTVVSGLKHAELIEWSKYCSTTHVKPHWATQCHISQHLWKLKRHWLKNN